jgi:hypothetical protein
MAAQNDSFSKGNAVAILLLMIGAGCALAVPDLLLGLPLKCVLVRLSGLRCPFCGMTRDFVGMVHGILPRNNPCSLPFAAIAWVFYPAAIFRAWRRSAPVVCPEYVRRFMPAILGVMGILNNVW